MERDARRMRQSGPFVFAQATREVGVDAIAQHVLAACGRG
jgi:urease accessory protein